MIRHVLVLTTLVAVCATSEAGVNGRNRIHPVAPLGARLSAGARKNALAVGEYWSPDGAGTAFLVQRDGRDGLVLTNRHVAPRMPRKSQLEFGDTRARVSGWVSGSRHLDYALLRVRFAKPRLAPPPIPLGMRTIGRGERVYTIGFPDLSSLYLVLDDGPTSGTYTNFDRSAIDEKLERISGRVQTVNVGHEIGGGIAREFIDPDPLPNGRKSFAKKTFATDLQSLPGGSGSLVASAVDHRAVGLLWGGRQSHPHVDTHFDDPAWAVANGGFAIPVRDIVRELSRKRRRGTFTTNEAGAVDALLRDAQRDERMASPRSVRTSIPNDRRYAVGSSPPAKMSTKSLSITPAP